MASEIALPQPIPHRVVPDGCVDIVFGLTSTSYGGAASVVGTMTKPIFAELRGKVNYTAIRFLPGGALRFLDNPMHDFTDRIVPLEAVSGKEGRNLAQDLISQNQIEGKIRLIESYLTRRLNDNCRSDAAVEGALRCILRNRGNIRIRELARISGGSERQLRRKFAQWVGVGPKVLCRIIRFQHVLQMLGRGSRHNVLFAALDSGYYDQSHFIHEFHAYYGVNPSEFTKITNLW
jgi:AraC-like DNA-binding protein